MHGRLQDMINRAQARIDHFIETGQERREEIAVKEFNALRSLLMVYDLRKESFFALLEDLQREMMEDYKAVRFALRASGKG